MPLGRLVKRIVVPSTPGSKWIRSAVASARQASGSAPWAVASSVARRLERGPERRLAGRKPSAPAVAVRVLPLHAPAQEGPQVLVHVPAAAADELGRGAAGLAAHPGRVVHERPEHRRQDRVGDARPRRVDDRGARVVDLAVERPVEAAGAAPAEVVQQLVHPPRACARRVQAALAQDLSHHRPWRARRGSRSWPPGSWRTPPMPACACAASRCPPPACRSGRSIRSPTGRRPPGSSWPACCSSSTSAPLFGLITCG